MDLGQSLLVIDYMYHISIVFSKYLTIVLVLYTEYGANELFIEKAKTRHLALQREAKIRNEEEIVHSFAVKKSFSDLTGVNAVVLEGLSKNDLKSMSGVVGVYPDLPVYPTAYSWGTDRIDQSALPLSSTYNSYFKGCGVDIYVVDTGLDTTHIEFAPVNGVSRTVSNIYNQFGAIAADTDGDGHGTHCAGIVRQIICAIFLTMADLTSFFTQDPLVGTLLAPHHVQIFTD